MEGQPWGMEGLPWGCGGCGARALGAALVAPAVPAVPMPRAGDRVYTFDLELQVMKSRSWPGLGPCDAALRWLERYYCLRGTRFWRFQPLTGEVLPGYPRDLRDYFIPCPGRGERPATLHGPPLGTLPRGTP